MPRTRRTGRTARALVRVVRGATVATGAAWALLACASRALAESPTPAAAAGDPRSAGQGPGLVGDPLAAIGLVALIALVSIGLTFAYLRSTGGSRGGPATR